MESLVKGFKENKAFRFTWSSFFWRSHSLLLSSLLMTRSPLS